MQLTLERTFFCFTDLWLLIEPWLSLIIDCGTRVFDPQIPQTASRKEIRVQERVTQATTDLPCYWGESR